MIEGLSPNQPIHTNENGGKQSATPYAFHLIPPHAMFELAKVVAEGEKYGAGNWRRIPIAHHINHAQMHLCGYLAGDDQDAHLSHAVCRIAFALELDFLERTRKNNDARDNRPID